MPQFSHPVVHPLPAVVAAPPAQWQGQQAPAPDVEANGDGNPPPGVIMRNRGKWCRLGMRLTQAVFAAAALAVMATTQGFASVTAFRYLVVAATVQCLWSLAVAIMHVYALLVKRFFQNARVYSILALGDWVTGTLIFSAACGSAAITVLLDNDLRSCPGNHCASFMTATAMAFLCWFVRVPSGLASLWWAVYKIQRS